MYSFQFDLLIMIFILIGYKNENYNKNNTQKI